MWHDHTFSQSNKATKSTFQGGLDGIWKREKGVFVKQGGLGTCQLCTSQADKHCSKQEQILKQHIKHDQN